MLLKDQLFNQDTVSLLFTQISNTINFEKEVAIKRALNEFPKLELKERITAVTSILFDMLPKNFVEVVGVFDQVIENVKDNKFIYGAILEYLETYGCNDEHYELALSRLGIYTRAFSAEFAIRSFINNYEEDTFKYVNDWAVSTDVDTRRLASEGTRPLLPWAKKIHSEYSLAIEWLNKLYTDSERYVTRSVANHLNDISKIDPELVIKTLNEWKSRRTDKEMDYIINHSLRTLIKRGNKEALEFLGFTKNPNVIISSFNSEDSIYKGEHLHFNAALTFKEDAKVVVDYIVWYQSKSGRPSKKVYKLTQITAKKGEVVPLGGKVSFLERTTRKIYPGLHTLELQVNGDVLSSIDIEVKEK